MWYAIIVFNTVNVTLCVVLQLLVSGGLSEEEQMMRAIALSLELGGEADGSSGSSKKEGPEEPKEITPQPLDSSVLNGFTANLMTNCLKLIDTVPDAAHKLCSLFTAVGRRNGLEWQESAMLQLRDEVYMQYSCSEIVLCCQHFCIGPHSIVS